MRFLPAVFFAIALPLAAQTPEVPHKMDFAGMTLTIRDDARKEIQKDVDALTQSPRHYNIKVERARSYFPIIEKIFAEEHLPDDFKFLVLQESALIPDAVSTSNAVGFWQFKDFTAAEMGLRVDRMIDERMNIVSSTRAAAGYLKKNNTFFNNWLYALQAYQMGAGGVMRSADKSENGAKHMDITSKTYWYVKKFLAHKIAFEESVKGPAHIRISTYENTVKKTASEWAKELDIDEEQLRAYNKWIKGNTIPDDKVYAVLKPVVNPNASVELPSRELALGHAGNKEVSAKTVKGVHIAAADKIRINGVTAIRAAPGDKGSAMADKAGITFSAFLKNNDLAVSDAIEPGNYYFTGKKRGRAREAYHKVVQGESLWKISQHYGMQLKKLKKFNRIDSDRDIHPGMTLWLSAKRPKNDKAGGISDKIIEIDKGETFSWEAAQPPVAEVSTKLEESPTIKIQPPTSHHPKAPKVEANVEPVKVVEHVKEEVAEEVKEVPPVVQTRIIKVDSSAIVVVKKRVNTDSLTVREKITIRPEKHEVVPGETLYGIAKKYDVEVMDLLEWNALDLKAGIKPGQILKLVGEKASEMEPPATPVNETEIIHEVKGADTLYSVARKYGVTIKDIMEWNNKKDFSISIGERIRIIRK